MAGLAPPARPYTLIVRTTERCEVGCNHCSINATPRGRDAARTLIESVLPDARAAGVGLIHFSGGEPLLHADLEQFVRTAEENGLFVELTTSTWTKRSDNPILRIAALRQAGLQRVMLSYDAAHARQVDIGHYAEFMREALDQNIEVCACIVEWPGSEWTLERVRAECGERGCTVDQVDWCRIGLSVVGRAAGRHAPPAEPEGSASVLAARCPYVLTAPTLAPDGTVFLCPNLESRSRLFRLGSVHEIPVGEILASLEASRFYRSLALHGPGRLLTLLGDQADGASMPVDMCGACQRLLQEAERQPEVRQRIEDLAPADGTPVALDIEALLPGHRRWVLGEERSETGCVCG